MPDVEIKPFSAADETVLRDALKRCSPETLEAALTYRQKGDHSAIPAVILGIVERFLEPETRPRLKEANAAKLRLIEDLGIDSLTMVEIVIMTEETLSLSIDNEELKDLRSLEDVHMFVDCKIKGKPSPSKPVHVGVEEIYETMPHGHPFLFLQDATIRQNEAQATYEISGSEFFLEGHFKHTPVFPASIMLEAIGQLAVLYILKSDHPEFKGRSIDNTKIFFTSCDGVRAQRICKPKDILSITVKPKRFKHPLATFEGSITVAGEKAAFVEEVTLTFDFLPEASQTETEASKKLAHA